MSEESALILYSYGCTHLPSRKYFTSIEKHKPTDRPAPPRGYKLWLDIFDDVSGYNVFVFYPSLCKKGDFINIIFIGVFGKVVNILWEHGDCGLFADIIYPMLFDRQNL